MQATPTPLNEKLIVQYLLGELPEEQRIEIEDQAFQSEDHMLEILNVESDLIDDYVRGEIPANKRGEFERYFLASAERRRKVEFARTLAALDSPVEQEVSLLPGRLNPFVAFIQSLSPAGSLAFGVAALIVVVGAGWLVTDVIRLRSQLNQLQAEKKTQEQQRQELEQQLLNERSQNEALLAQLNQQKKGDVPPNLPQPKEESVAPPNQSGILALTLLPGLSRGGGEVPLLTLKPGVESVRLRVVIDPQDAYPKYGAEVRGPKGEKVVALNNWSPRGSRKSIGLILPSRSLSAGRYEVALKGIRDTGSTELGYYYFEVTK